MSTGPYPIDAASASQRSSSSSGSGSAFAVRVSREAAAAAAGPDCPVRASSISISTRRFENSRRTFFGMPAISDRPSWTGPHSTPRRFDSSLRRTLR